MSEHAESRVSARRDANLDTARPTPQHGESRDSARRDTELDTAGDPRAHGGGLADRQAALIAALVAGAPDPEGFDAARLAATRRALLRKRAGEAAREWPVLAASFGSRWASVFASHHAGRASEGALRDGWDLARALRRELTADAAVELGEREALLRYDGTRPPRPRRLGLARLALHRLRT